MQKTIEKHGIAIVVFSIAIVGLLFVGHAVVDDLDHSLDAGDGATLAQAIGLLDEKTTTAFPSTVHSSAAQTEMLNETPRSDREGKGNEAAENELDKKDNSGQSQNRVYILRKVQPTYPTRALERGIEGYVLLEFTVTVSGLAIDPTVVESDPAGIFDRAALEALSKFRYRPRVVDGEPVRTEGVRHRIDFEIEDDSTTRATAAAGIQSDCLPSRRVAPTYPKRAIERGIEGYVVLEFTVNETGSVIDPAVVESEPAGIFDRSAIQAASKFKYRPRVDDGKSVRTEGVRHRFEYKLENEESWSLAVATEELPDDTEHYDGDEEYLPIRTVRPTYPERALQRGIEGYVVVEFTVDEIGEVVDPSVVESEPPGIFDRSAIQASRKFKYQPRVIDGAVVRIEGVKHKFEFDIEHAN